MRLGFSLQFFSQKLSVFFILFSVFFLFPLFARADSLDFNVDRSFDYLGRSQVTAFLQQIGENAYFYVEEDYFGNLTLEERKSFSDAIRSLSQEFDNNIYPKIRENYGSEWNPGIDGENKIYIFISRLKQERGGYFNTGDEFSKLQVPNSNEKELIYLNASYVSSSLAKTYLAHEFTHLITYNQKDRIRGAIEEIWLNEARAEMAPTILGYDDEYQGSNLQKRVRTFSQNTTDPITEWKDASADYGVLNIFFQYFIDHYGVKILKDSLLSGKTGIDSLNDALKKAGFPQDFSQIFTDWTIAVFINDCSLGVKYCYLNPNLKNLSIVPQINYLPLQAESTLTVTNYAKSWSGNWFRFIGNKGTLKLEFAGDSRASFKLPYLARDFSGNYSLDFFNLNGSQQSTIYLADFGTKYESLTILPSIQNRTSGFNNIESFYKFIWSVSVLNNSSDNQELIDSLLSQIDFLKKEIARVKNQIQSLSSQNGNNGDCQSLSINLSYGMKKSQAVTCLQKFLKDQGSDIYSQGLVTGNFLTLTREAVIRFQEKYKAEILAPVGLERGTGFVGPLTRAKINQLLNSK